MSAFHEWWKQKQPGAYTGADYLKQKAAFNAGMERAKELAINVADSMKSEGSSPSWNDACESIAEDIYREIK